MIAGTVVNLIAGTLWFLNASKAWVAGAWLYIPITLTTQIALIPFTDFSSVRQVLIFNLISSCAESNAQHGPEFSWISKFPARCLMESKRSLGPRHGCRYSKRDSRKHRRQERSFASSAEGGNTAFCVRLGRLR